MTTLHQDSVKFDFQQKILICQGEWNLANLVLLKKSLSTISWPTSGEIVVNGKSVAAMDSAGAWLLSSYLKTLGEKVNFRFQDFSDHYQKLLTLVEKKSVTEEDLPKITRPRWIERVGRAGYEFMSEVNAYLSFIGRLMMEALRITLHPTHFRFRELVSVIYKDGFRALPIITLLSFMIGIVIAYQMGVQLRNYGANIFIVDLLGLSVLREFGPLITAIMLAGRTGSAFTAQLGIMKVNQEIAALNTMGVTPAELLLLPRIAGLFIALPLLTMWADILGILGGMIMADNMLDVGWFDFLTRFQQEVPLRSLIIGLGKAPIFALIIASIGCFEGMQVKGSADSVGSQTTRSVVLSIFFIIVADAILSVIFSRLQL